MVALDRGYLRLVPEKCEGRTCQILVWVPGYGVRHQRQECTIIYTPAGNNQSWRRDDQREVSDRRVIRLARTKTEILDQRKFFYPKQNLL